MSRPMPSSLAALIWFMTKPGPPPGDPYVQDAKALTEFCLLFGPQQAAAWAARHLFRSSQEDGIFVGSGDGIIPTKSGRSHLWTPAACRAFSRYRCAFQFTQRKEGTVPSAHDL